MMLVNKAEDRFSQLNDPKIDASWVRLIYIALKKEKLPAEKIFNDSGLTVKSLKEREYVSQKAVHSLYANIERYGALELLPIYITNVFQFHFLRHVGGILADSETISDLLNKITVVTSKLSQLARAEITSDSRYTKLTLSSTTNSYKLHPISLISAICLVTKVVKQGYPHVKDPVSHISLCKSAPIELLSNNFEYPIVQCKDGTYSVFFERSMLSVSNIFHTRSPNMTKAISDLNGKSDLSLYSEVEQLIVKNIGKSSISIVDVADHINTSVKTLQRLLLRFNTSFSELVQLNRMRLALFHLRENELTIKQISFALGFNSPSSFSRAFKQWTGVSPSQFQKEEDC